MVNEYMTKEFWEKAPQGYDYWIVPSEELEDEVDSDFHRYEPNWSGRASYVDAKDMHWMAENEGLNYTVYKRPKFEEETGKSLGKSGVKWDGNGIPPIGSLVVNKEDFKGFSEVILHRHGGVIVEQEDGVAADYILLGKSQCIPYTKELTMKEKMLDKWKLQALEFSEDDETATYCIGTVFDFILKNFEIKEKE